MSLQFVDYPFKARVYEPKPAQAAQKRHPVVIVGGGPVGLTAAVALAVQGVPSILVEADNSVCFGSRAICLSRRSLQIFKRLGAEKSFLSKGLPWTSGRCYYRNREVLHFSMPHERNQQLPPMLNIEQYYIEQFLLERAEALSDLIDIRWATRVTGLEQKADHVVANLTNETGSHEIEADWLVAADGGQSFVRDALGLMLQGNSYEGRYVIADIAIDIDLPTERLAWFDPPSNPGSSVLMHRQPDNVWRIDYQIDRNEDPQEAVKPENVLPRIQQHLDFIGIKAPWDPIWITIYRAHALSLERYRHGRVLFAGDAAHLVPIFGVRGANSGIDDADNLAWKLASVIKGRSSETLLDSYCEERVFATMQNLSYGRKSTEFMAPPSFGFELMREAVLNLANGTPEVTSLINPRQSSTIHYDQSSLNIYTDDEASFTGGPAPGEIFAEGQISTDSGGYLGDHLGHGCTLVHFGADATLPQALDWPPATTGLSLIRIGQAQDSDDVEAIDPDGSLWENWDARPGTVYLLRPDGHVLGRWRRFSKQAVHDALVSLLDIPGARQ